MIKRYRSTYADDCEMLVDIDHDIMTDEMLHEINNFWNGADHRLENEDGNVVNAILKMLHRRALYLDVEYRYSLDGLISLFDTQEGWPPMNGTAGIKIIALDSLEIDDDRIEIEEVTNV